MGFQSSQVANTQNYHVLTLRFQLLVFFDFDSEIFRSELTVMVVQLQLKT